MLTEVDSGGGHDGSTRGDGGWERGVELIAHDQPGHQVVLVVIPDMVSLGRRMTWHKCAQHEGKGHAKFDRPTIPSLVIDPALLIRVAGRGHFQIWLPGLVDGRVLLNRVADGALASLP
jgi:hypothetical protein